MIVKRKQFSKAERQRIWNICNGHCGYCGCDLPFNKMQVDHIISIEKAKDLVCVEGDINNKDNLLPSCGSCNRYKREMELEEFRKWMKEIVKRLRSNNVTYRIAERWGMVKELEWDGKFYFERERGIE